MHNVITFNDTPMELQAIVLNPKLLKIIRQQEADNKKFEAKMDEQIKKNATISKAGKNG